MYWYLFMYILCIHIKIDHDPNATPHRYDFWTSRNPSGGYGNLKGPHLWLCSLDFQALQPWSRATFSRNTSLAIRAGARSRGFGRWRCFFDGCWCDPFEHICIYIYIYMYLNIHVICCWHIIYSIGCRWYFKRHKQT